MSIATSLTLSDTKLTSTDARSYSVTGLRSLTLLTTGSENEVLEFLRARPIHTVIMAGYIHDNGLVSERNRGSFYCYRNPDGRIEGIALIGHATLFETRSGAAVAAFARLSRALGKSHIVIGEQRNVDQFWRWFAKAGHVPHELRRELLFARDATSTHNLYSTIPSSVRELRLATRDDLEVVTMTHARLAVEELGLDNPIAVDPEGFLRRCAQRIDQGRVWVLVEDRALVFKADVVSETPEATYLEGIYVDPKKRGRGYGLKCLSQLSNHLLSHTRSICLFVNEQNPKAQAFYRNIGFRQCGYYTTILLRTANQY